MRKYQPVYVENPLVQQIFYLQFAKFNVRKTRKDMKRYSCVYVVFSLSCLSFIRYISQIEVKISAEL